MNPTAPSQSTKILPLTSLRFFAALMVVFYHSAPSFLPFFSGTAVDRHPDGLVGNILLSFTASVSFFFFLSGYVLAVVYLREGRSVDQRRFFAARFARVYPLYFVLLLINTPVLFWVELQRYGTAAALVKTGKIAAANALMLQAWVPERLLRVNSPTWSLCGEAFFYLCFPVLGVWLWRLRGLRLLVTAVVLYVGGQALVLAARPHLGRQTVLYLPLLHLSTFALGVLMARWQRLQQDRMRGAMAKVWQVTLVLGLSVCGMVLSVFVLPQLHIPQLYNDGLLVPIFAGFVWALSMRVTWLSKWLSRSWPVALGDSVYALYLIHMPMLLLFLHFRWVATAAYPLYVGLCVGLSVVSFFYFETPVRQWLLQRFHTRSLETIEAASTAS